MKLVNAYTVLPDDIQEGDVMLFVVKAMVMHRDSDGKLCYRLYRCELKDLYSGNLPQGTQICSEEVCQALFPSLALVGKLDC